MYVSAPLFNDETSEPISNESPYRQVMFQKILHEKRLRTFRLEQILINAINAYSTKSLCQALMINFIWLKATKMLL
jgi:hypothetical protein